MGCTSSSPAAVAESSGSSAIDAELRAERNQQEGCIKLLLLGSGECGKSTILKQMRLLHSTGFSDEERAIHADIIRANCLSSIHTLLKAARSFDMQFADPRSVAAVHLMESTKVLFPSSEALEAISWLWREDRVIAKVMQRQSELTLLDSAPYFLDSIQRILDPRWVPSDQDMLRSRLATTGIIETVLNIRSSQGSAALKFRFVDVGGQRGERKKWIHCFENVRAILFIASLNEFDQALQEDRSKNRMRESLALFEGILALPWFAERTSVILFLNKNDLFRAKIQRVDLGAHFAGYSGGCNYDRALDYIKEMFFARNKDPNRAIYCHATDATDTQGMKFVWRATKHIILYSNLGHAGLV